MLQTKIVGALALVGLLVSAASHADDRRSQPQIRVGIDLLWGGHGGHGGYGYAPPPPPVVWYPSHYAPPRYRDNRHDRGNGYGYGRSEWRRNDHHKGKHKHRGRRGDRCDD